MPTTPAQPAHRGPLAALLPLVLLLSACAAGPSPAPSPAPAPLPPAVWQASLPHDGRSERLADWWRQFGDPALLALVEAAQTASPNVAAAQSRIAAARAPLVLAEAQLRPSLSLDGRAGRSRSDPSMPVSTSLALGLQSQWELDLFGRNQAGRDAARERLQGASAGWHDARVAVAAEAAQAYTALRACEAQREQAAQDLRSRQETARLTDLAARAGLQAASAAALARASAAQGSQQLAQQAAQCELLLKSLVALTALDEPALRQLVADGRGRLPRPAGIAVPAVPAQALAQRPDLAVAERELLAAAHEVRASEASWYPRVTLGGSIGAARTVSMGSSTEGSTWSIGPLSVTLPLVDGGVRQANLDAARARVDEARSAYAARLRAAVREVEEALVTLASSAERERDAQLAAEQFAVSLQAAQQRYQGGFGSLFELEDARRSALQAQGALIELRRERTAAWIALYRALGGGWQPEPTPVAGAARPAAAP